MSLLDILKGLFKFNGAIVDDDRTPFCPDKYEPRPASVLDPIDQEDKEFEGDQKAVRVPIVRGSDLVQ